MTNETPGKPMQVTRHDETRRGARALFRRGNVLMIALLAVILIAALLAYVVNLGRQANARIVAQNAADATAISGAGWVARTMNTIAMNNVSMARMISLVNVLDGMPLAIEFTLKDQQAIHDALSDQINSANGRTGIADPWVHDALTATNPRLAPGTRLSRRSEFRPLFDEVAAEVAMLKPVDQALNHADFDMREMTFYNGPAGRGTIWQAMESLDTINQTMVENVTALSQTNAALAGIADTNPTAGLAADDSTVRVRTRQDAGAALLLPGDNPIPFTRGHFDDFDRPVTNGLLPGDVDDKMSNRGPYDTIFGWRVPLGQEVTRRPGIPPSDALPGTVARGVNFDTQIVGEPDAYTVYGPHGWLLRQLVGIERDQLRHSRFGNWSGRNASIKLNYLWPGGPVQTLVSPRWITNLADVYQTADSRPGAIVETCFVAVELKSRYRRGDASFLSAGSYVLEEPSSSWSPRVIRVPGWVDPRRWSVPRLDQAVWRDEWSYPVNFDSEIGIAQSIDPATGQPAPKPVYRIDEYILVGINTGTPVEVRSPHNFTSRADLPSPINADYTRLTNSNSARRQYLTYLGVAAKHDRSLLWPSQFAGGKSEPSNFAVAQAKIFNDHSWDLWTQMWRVQLEPVSGVQEWNTEIDRASQTPPEGALIDAPMIEKIARYMRSVESLAPVMMTH